MTTSSLDPWVFGYGSLVWRPAFAYRQRIPATLSGWTRRFWQSSPDHRGTPERPGRVATLIRDPSAECMGMAYEVSNSVYDEVMTQLDYREKHGYQRVFEALKLADGRVVHATVYVAGPTNPGFIGAAPLAEMAGQISECVGPSGANRDYLSELAEALRAMGADDPHVFELEEALNRVD